MMARKPSAPESVPRPRRRRRWRLAPWAKDLYGGGLLLALALILLYGVMGAFGRP